MQTIKFLISNLLMGAILGSFHITLQTQPLQYCTIGILATILFYELFLYKKGE